MLLLRTSAVAVCSPMESVGATPFETRWRFSGGLGHRGGDGSRMEGWEGPWGGAVARGGVARGGAAAAAAVVAAAPSLALGIGGGLSLWEPFPNAVICGTSVTGMGTL